MKCCVVLWRFITIKVLISARTKFCQEFTDVFLFSVHFILRATLNCWAFSKCNSRYQFLSLWVDPTENRTQSPSFQGERSQSLGHGAKHTILTKTDDIQYKRKIIKTFYVQNRLRAHYLKLIFSFNFYSDLQSAAWRSGSERRFYDDHDREVNGSTPNIVSFVDIDKLLYYKDNVPLSFWPVFALRRLIAVH